VVVQHQHLLNAPTPVMMKTARAVKKSRLTSMTIFPTQPGLELLNCRSSMQHQSLFAKDHNETKGQKA
jgi:hypothetical protein